MCKVLVVDDNEMNREFLIEAFKRGWEDYILKLMNVSQLLVKIQAKLCWRETRDEV